MKTQYFSKKDKAQFKFLKVYNGSQLRPLFNYEVLGLSGDAMSAWIGECNVSTEHMVDYEDKIVKSKIKGQEMLHFIIEVFPANLAFGVVLQRLLASIVIDLLNEELTNENKYQFIREGDDIYWINNKNKKFKLSISIATVSAVSTLVHFAINIVNAGTPVATAALKDNFKINPDVLAKKVLTKFSSEYEDIMFATKKVKPL